jgi:hypothetical protein
VRGQAQRLGMMNLTDLRSVPSDHLVPFTGQLRLAVAACLARFKGSSRYHAESDLRCYLAWCAQHGLDPLSARRPHLELYIRWMQEIRRFKPSTVSRRFSVTHRVLPDLRHRRPAGELTRRTRPPALGPAGIADPGVHPPAIRGPAHRGPRITEYVRLRTGGHARAARLADLRSHRGRHRRPRRRTRPPGAGGVRQRHQVRADPAPAGGRARHRPRDRRPAGRRPGPCNIISVRRPQSTRHWLPPGSTTRPAKAT